MARVRIWVKKQIRVDHLNFKQFEMLKLGTVGLAAVKNRVQSATNSEDKPAAPLSKKYARWKAKRLRRKAVRDLTFTGGMLRNLQVRTVSNTSAFARNSTTKDREKANRQQQLELWLTFSPNDQQRVFRAAEQIFRERSANLIRFK